MPVERTCAACKTTFFTRHLTRPQKFCGADCWRNFEIENGRVAARKTPVDFACKTCGNPFQMMQSYVTAYVKKHGKNPMYCSRPCSATGRMRDAEARNKFTCNNCGKETFRARKGYGKSFYYEQILCSKQCKNEWTSKVYREKHGLPQVTRRIKRRYVVLRFPAMNGIPMHELLEHRYVMEQSIGRKLLPKETVHHINGDTRDNRIENLELFGKNHGPGQRVTDLVKYALEVVKTYPEIANAMGYDVEHITAEPAARELPTEPPS